MNEKESFVFYRSFYEAIHKVEDKNIKADIFEAICELALNNEELELQDTIGNIIMELIKPQIKANNKRYEDGKKGGRPKKKDNKITTGYDETKTTGYENEKPNVNVNDNVNVNENDNKENIKRKNFIKPTLSEVKEYCLERSNTINPEIFINYYEANGWKVGKNPMKDWKACIRSWEAKDYNKKPQEQLPEWFGKEIKKEEISDERKAKAEAIRNGTYRP